MPSDTRLNEHGTFPGPLKWFVGYTVATMLALGTALATGQYLALGLPVVVWLVVQAVTNFRPLFYLLLVGIPISTDLRLPGGLSTDVPTEPLAVGLTALFAIYVLRHWDRLRASRFFHPIAILLYVHVAWICVTTLTSSEVGISTKFTAAKLWYVGAYFLMPLLLLRRPGQVRLAVQCIFWPLLFVAVQTVLRHGLIYEFSFAFQHKTMWPFMPEHVSYAGALAAFTPWLAYLVWARRRRGLSTGWYVWLLLPFWVVALYFSFTRAAFVALALAGGVYFVVRWRLLAPVILAGLVAAVFSVAYVVQDNRYLEYAPDFDATISHDEFGNLISATYKLEDISTMERLYRWVAAGHMVPYRPWLGWGPGSFLENYRGYAVNNFETYVSDNEGRSGIHSYYLMTLVEQGFPGLLLFMAYIIGALLYAARAYHRARDPYARNAIMAALLALTIVDAFNIINDQMETDKVGAQYLLNLGIIVAMSLWPGEGAGADRTGDGDGGGDGPMGELPEQSTPKRQGAEPGPEA